MTEQIQEQVELSEEQKKEQEKMLAVQQGYILQELTDSEDIEAILALQTKEEIIDFAIDRLAAAMAASVQTFMQTTGNILPALYIENLVDKTKAEEIVLPFLVNNGFTYHEEVVHAKNPETSNVEQRKYYVFELKNTNAAQVVDCKYVSDDVRIFVLTAIHVINMSRQPLTTGTLQHYVRQAEIAKELGSVAKVKEAIEFYVNFIKEQNKAQEEVANVQQSQEEDNLRDAATQ